MPVDCDRNNWNKENGPREPSEVPLHRSPTAAFSKANESPRYVLQPAEGADVLEPPAHKKPAVDRVFKPKAASPHSWIRVGRQGAMKTGGEPKTLQRQAFGGRNVANCV